MKDYEWELMSFGNEGDDTDPTEEDPNKDD